ncbi:MAG: TonB family protein [Rickettsiales bacterium]|nr:TonB family protein [Rickettsiales bacterium]
MASALLHCAVGWWLLSAPAEPPPVVLSFAVEVEVTAAATQDVAAESSEEAKPAPEAKEAVPVPHSGFSKQAKIEKPRKEMAAPKMAPKMALLAPAAAARQAVIAPVTPASFIGAAVNNPAPVYPEAARKRNEEGRVLLSVFVRENGEAGEVRLASSSGYAQLDEAALAAVKAWRFAPAKRDEQVIASWVNVPVSFQLHQ